MKAIVKRERRITVYSVIAATAMVLAVRGHSAHEKKPATRPELPPASQAPAGLGCDCSPGDQGFAPAVDLSVQSAADAESRAAFYGRYIMLDEDTADLLQRAHTVRREILSRDDLTAEERSRVLAAVPSDEAIIGEERWLNVLAALSEDAVLGALDEDGPIGPHLRRLVPRAAGVSER